MNFDLNELERVLSLSINLWIKRKDEPLDACFDYVLKDYNISKQRFESINKLLNETKEDWLVITGTVGLRLSYKTLNTPNQSKAIKLKDILNQTFINVQTKGVF